jgi:hypothetical protein
LKLGKKTINESSNKKEQQQQQQQQQNKQVNKIRTWTKNPCLWQLNINW